MYNVRSSASRSADISTCSHRMVRERNGISHLIHWNHPYRINTCHNYNISPLRANIGRKNGTKNSGLSRVSRTQYRHILGLTQMGLTQK